ncbi:hypothetical protein BIS47_58 [Klebsiella phage vB_KpnM_BIS47]|uniref:Uncharacterized protein n=1 Tax=Klebsiella phage vB_KpnM_BIS47 TaxID=1907784 RepID=A0A1V0E6Q1_9CAUD|nr:hypothetical protein BIS47_58 [Klebsiella phage vB_KpnM_BIS47]ARB12562.1 hypothetical protein BIS47_58 [Klebsiella phage vB_KpnM_BIS47]
MVYSFQFISVPSYFCNAGRACVSPLALFTADLATVGNFFSVVW